MKANSLEIARRLDAIYDTYLTNDLVLSLSLSSPSYTLAEIEVLAKEWNTGLGLTHGEQRVVDWAVSNLLAHLAKREKELRG